MKFDDGDRDRAVPERGIAKEGGSCTRPGSASEVDQAVLLSAGSQVEAKCKGSARYYVGTIMRDHRNGTYDVKFDDGDRDIEVPRKSIKLLGGDTKAGFPASKPAGKKLLAGTRIEARFGGRQSYVAGKVVRARLNGSYDIAYDNGERETGVKRALIRLDDSRASPPAKAKSSFGGRSDDDDEEDKIAAGCKVDAKCKGSARFYPGTVMRDHRNGTFDVKFDDGDRDIEVPRKSIRVV